MRIHYSKLRNMTHALSVSIAFKGTNFYIFILPASVEIAPFVSDLFCFERVNLTSRYLDDLLNIDNIH